LLVGVHIASFGVTVTPMVPLPAMADTVAVSLVKANVGVTPLCVTVNVRPPIVSVPVLLFALGLAATP
jgi:hypothetical protein